MKMKFLLTAILMLYYLNNTNAQSHISTGKYACQLVPKSLGYEKYTCPACAANNVKVAQAKAEEDKRRNDAAIAKANADKAARDLAYKKEQKEKEEKNKVTEVGLSMSSDESLTNSTSNTGSSNSHTYNSVPTYTKSEITTQTTNLAGKLLDSWSNSYDIKWAKIHAEQDARADIIKQKRSDKFELAYFPLMDLAKKGDKNARMILYFTSDLFNRKFSVPLREQWYEEELTNSNIDALLVEASNSIFNYKKGDEILMIPKIEKIANMGSLDAMVMLANWYDWRSDGGYKKGGDNPKKALEWYNKAAEKGCPSAMYRLGMIYKYGKTQKIGIAKNWHVKYDVITDEKIAFDWFSKSLQPYNESMYSKSSTYEYFLCSFNKESFYELSEIYKRGKVVPKDNKKAIELDKIYKEFENTQKFNYIK